MSAYAFELKGGTSLSKGYQIIDRFSEDIDIRIEPPKGRDVKIGPNKNKAAHVRSREEFYDWLASTIRIPGIDKVERDMAFDDKLFRSAGIRLLYRPAAKAIEGLKAGVLLEVGFDDVTPNATKDISSWLYDYAAGKVEIIDNRAKGVACCVVGRLPLSTTIVRVGPVAGRTDFEPSPIWRYLDESPPKRAYTEQRVLTELAGSIAHDIFQPGRTHDVGDETDLRITRELISELVSWQEYREEYLAQARAKAVQLLKTHWRWVEAVAHALLERKALLRDEILSLRPDERK